MVKQVLRRKSGGRPVGLRSGSFGPVYPGIPTHQ